MSFLVPSRREGEKTFKPFIMLIGSAFGKTKTSREADIYLTM